jgi:hypothetical protein
VEQSRVNAELNCHFFAECRCPSFNEPSISRARSDCRLRRASYAVPPLEDLAESRAGRGGILGSLLTEEARVAPFLKPEALAFDIDGLE